MLRGAHARPFRRERAAAPVVARQGRCVQSASTPAPLVRAWTARGGAAGGRFFRGRTGPSGRFRHAAGCAKVASRSTDSSFQESLPSRRLLRARVSNGELDFVVPSYAPGLPGTSPGGPVAGCHPGAVIAAVEAAHGPAGRDSAVSACNRCWGRDGVIAIEGARHAGASASCAAPHCWPRRNSPRRRSGAGSIALGGRSPRVRGAAVTRLGGGARGRAFCGRSRCTLPGPRGRSAGHR